MVVPGITTAWPFLDAKIVSLSRLGWQGSADHAEQVIE
jgi:hypothetical protein